MKLLNFLFLLLFIPISALSKDGEILIESLTVEEIDDFSSVYIDLKKISMESDGNAFIPHVDYRDTGKKIILYFENSIKVFNVPSKINSQDEYIGCFSESKGKLFFLANDQDNKLLLYETGKLTDKEVIHEYDIDNEAIKWVGNDCEKGYILLENGTLKSFDLFDKKIKLKVLRAGSKDQIFGHNSFVNFDGEVINLLTTKTEDHYVLNSSYVLKDNKNTNYEDGEMILSSDSLWSPRVDACAGKFLLDVEEIRENNGGGIVARFSDKRSGKKIFSKRLYSPKLDGIIFTEGLTLGKMREKYVAATVGSSLIKDDKGFSKYMVYFFTFDVNPYCSEIEKGLSK